MKPVRPEPAATRSQVKHSTTEPLRSLKIGPFFLLDILLVPPYFEQGDCVDAYAGLSLT